MATIEGFRTPQQPHPQIPLRQRQREHTTDGTVCARAVGGLRGQVSAPLQVDRLDRGEQRLAAGPHFVDVAGRGRCRGLLVTRGHRGRVDSQFELFQRQQQRHNVVRLRAQAPAFRVARLAGSVSRFLDPPRRQIGEFRPDNVEQLERLDPLLGERCALVEGLDALSRQPDGFGQVGWSAYESQVESVPHPGIPSAGQFVGLDDPVGPHVVGVDGLARLRHHTDEVAEGLRLPLPVGRVGPPHQHPQQMNLPGVERGAFGSRADAFQPATDGSFVDGNIFFAVLHEPPPGGLGSKYPDIDIPADSRWLRGLVAGLVAGLVDRDEAFDCRHPTPHIVIFSFY